MTGKILIVDHSVVMRQLLKEFLVNNGFQVVIATDGREGLATLETTVISMVICDVHMPVMSGIEMVATLRSIPAYQSLPVLVLTANPLRGTIARALAAGADRCLSKPVHFGQLLQQVREYLGGKRLRRALPKILVPPSVSERSAS